MRVVLALLGAVLLLGVVGLGNWVIWNSLDLRESGPWWRYTLMGSDLAEDLIGISAVVVIGLIFAAGVVGWGRLLLSRRGEAGVKLITAQLLIGCLGFAVVRGIVQHWSWWIIRWDEASIFKDFICGTVWFCCIGFIAGFFVAMLVMVVTAAACVPILLLVRRLMYGRNPPPLVFNRRLRSPEATHAADAGT
jgi:hypothetical protein